ncbi:hypothetical protein HF313_07715 [Massilia atriviolacea]|uniref:DUF4034 domain-containing protein n=1 Tax=Massilia atriviolacea TaxID=2495579 RepID=A0A430HM36_9BURK|nr:hypothetical protein [Massilia atriviolacea]RSZ58627.1 hypothetical protein EJB06_13430 [Massilia atriviolacea]
MSTFASIFPGARRFLALTCLSAALCAHAAVPDARASQGGDAELRTHEAIRQETARHLAAGDFGRLEALYRSLNHAGQRTPSGLWKLAIFYNYLRRFGTLTTDADYWDSVEGLARQWQASYPKSVPARLFGVYLQLGRLHVARGGGLFSKLPEQQRHAVSYGADVAMRMLEQTRVLAGKANDPEWHRAMLSVAPYVDGMSAEGYRKRVRQALARHPNYHAAYFTAALYSHPRWGGTPDGVARLAYDASHAAGKEPPSMYARIYWFMDQSEYHGRLFDAGRADWPTMRTSFEHLVRLYPAAWNLNAFAYFACMAGDFAAMDAIVARIGSALLPEVWGADGEATQARCLAHRAPGAAPRVIQAALRPLADPQAGLAQEAGAEQGPRAIDEHGEFVAIVVVDRVAEGVRRRIGDQALGPDVLVERDGILVGLDAARPDPHRGLFRLALVDGLATHGRGGGAEVRRHGRIQGPLAEAGGGRDALAHDEVLALAE